MTLALLILSGFIILLLKIVSLEKYLKTLEKDIKQGFSTQDDFSPLPPPLPHHHPPARICGNVCRHFWFFGTW